jgi:hypothetical protein
MVEITGQGHVMGPKGSHESGESPRGPKGTQGTGGDPRQHEFYISSRYFLTLDRSSVLNSNTVSSYILGNNYRLLYFLTSDSVPALPNPTVGIYLPSQVSGFQPLFYSYIELQPQPELER